MTNITEISERQLVCLVSTELNKKCVDHIDVGFMFLSSRLHYSPGAESAMDVWEVKVIGGFCGKGSFKLLAGKFNKYVNPYVLLSLVTTNQQINKAFLMRCLIIFFFYFFSMTISGCACWGLPIIGFKQFSKYSSPHAYLKLISK